MRLLLSCLLLGACGQHVDGVDPSAWSRVVVDSLDGALPIDARTPEEVAAGHVPGAAAVHWTELTGPDTDGLWGAISPDDAIALLEARGIGTDRPVVVYGSGPGGYGDDGNVYWALRWLGHPDVRVLDGGWLGWIADGGQPVTTAAPPVADFDAAIDDTLLAETDEVEDWSGVVLDVRSREEFDAGHVPGAVWLEWTEVFSADETLQSEDQVQALMQDLGITTDTAVVTYCAGGIRAGHTFMVLDALGVEVANYVGSWARWSAEGGAVEY